MNPHPIPAKKNHFEGWYHRIVDRENSLSIAVIATAYRLKDSKQLRGYLSILLSREGESPVVYERSELPVEFFAQGRQVGPRTRLKKEIDYKIMFPGYGFASANELSVSINGLEVSMDWDQSSRVSWPASPISGLKTPADIAAFFKFLPAQWHVHDMGSKAFYSIKAKNSKLEINGIGEFHHEKNWGKSFPTSWYWLDAMDSSQEVYVAAAGGVLNVFEIQVNAFLIAIRTPEVSFDFSPARPGAKFKVKSDGCENFKINGSVGRYEFEISSTAPRRDFVSLLVPKPTGYEPGAIETLAAKMKLLVWEKRSFLSPRKLISNYTIDHVGLEFGNEAAKCALRN